MPQNWTKVIYVIYYRICTKHCVFLLGHSVDYIKATTEPYERGIVNFPIEMYLLGYYEGTQPLGPFWKPGFSDKFDENPDNVIKPRVARILNFARAMHNDLNTSSKERIKIWQDSYIAGGYLLCMRVCGCMQVFLIKHYLHLLLFDVDQIIFICPMTVGHIMVCLGSSARLSVLPSVNIFAALYRSNHMSDWLKFHRCYSSSTPNTWYWSLAL